MPARDTGPLGATALRAMVILAIFSIPIALASGCFPSFDLGGGGRGGSTATSVTTASGTSVDASGVGVSAGPGAGGGTGGCTSTVWPAKELGPVGMGSTSTLSNDVADITDVVALGGKVFVAGLFGGAPKVLRLDDAAGPPNPDTLTVSGYTGATIAPRDADKVWLVAYTSGAIDLYEIGASGSLGFSAKVVGCTPQSSGSFFRPSIATTSAGDTVLAIPATDNFTCTPTAQGSTTLPFNGQGRPLVGLLRLGQATPSTITLASTTDDRVEPRVAIAPKPGGDVDVFLATSTNLAPAQTLLFQFAWSGGPQGSSSMMGAVAANGSEERISTAVVGEVGFFGGTFRDRTQLESAMGTSFITPYDAPMTTDWNRIRAIHGGATTLAFAGSLTSMGLIVPGATVGCQSSADCGAVVTGDVLASGFATGTLKQLTIEPTGGGHAAATAVYVDACGQTYAAGSHLGSVMTSAGDPLTGSPGQRTGFLVKVP